MMLLSRLDLIDNYEYVFNKQKMYVFNNDNGYGMIYIIMIVNGYKMIV